MKTLKWLGLFLSFMVISWSFVACSDDDGVSDDSYTIHVEKAGTLRNLIPSNAPRHYKKLTLTGEINQLDVSNGDYETCMFIWHAETVDMENVSVVECETQENGKWVTYPKNYIDMRIIGGDEITKTLILPPTLDSANIGGPLEQIKLPKTLQTLSILGRNLKEVNLSESLRVLDLSGAFETINLPESLRILNGLHSSNLKSVTLPSGLLEIGEEAFRNCSALTEISIPDKITEIKESTFESCISLSTVHLPDGIERIGDRAFERCESLSDISFLPDGLKEIGIGAFSNCKFQSITIPENVQSIGYAAFSECSELKEMHVKATTPPTIGRDMFGEYFYSYIDLYVPRGSKELYMADPHWSDNGIVRTIIEE